MSKTNALLLGIFAAVLTQFAAWCYSQTVETTPGDSTQVGKWSARTWVITSKQVDMIGPDDLQFYDARLRIHTTHEPIVKRNGSEWIITFKP